MLLPNSVSSRPIYVLDQIELDYRTEVMAAGLLAGELAADSIPLDRLLFYPAGPNARSYSSDFVPPQFLAVEGNQAPYWRLETPREGLYDQLPPFLFHTIPSTLGGDFDAESILKQVRQAHEVEQETRQFFLPFDTELHYLRVLRCQHERQNDQLENAHMLIAQFAEGWPILHWLDPLRASLFIQLLPFIHQLRGNLSWLGSLLTVFFEVPIRFETEQPMARQAATESTPVLGQSRLGIDAIAGTTFDDGYNAIHLQVGPVPDTRVAEFLPHTEVRALLTELLAYFMPATAEIVLFISIERRAYQPNQPRTLYLGYNSYL